nr:uncharacterized protein LOC109154045 [Ipomoea batatas]
MIENASCRVQKFEEESKATSCSREGNVKENHEEITSFDLGSEGEETVLSKHKSITPKRKERRRAPSGRSREELLDAGVPMATSNEDSILSNSGFILRLKHGGFLGKGENPNSVRGLTAMYNNIEIDEWGLITLLDKMKELGYACVDSVQFFMKTVRGLVELVTDKVAWDTFNEMDLFDVVEVWAVGGEMNESFREDSSYDGEIDDSDCGSLDDLDYEINIDPNVEYCAPPVDQTSSQAPPVNQTSSQAPSVDQTSSPSDAQPAGMEDDITDQMLADLDIDAFVSNLIDGSGIGSGQQQQAPQVQWRFSTYTVGGRGSSGANDGSAMTLDHEHQGPKEIEVHTNSTQPPTDGDEDTQAERDDDNAKERRNPCHKAKKIKVIKNKHVVNGRKYGTRARFAALKAKFPPTFADSPFNVD